MVKNFDDFFLKIYSLTLRIYQKKNYTWEATPHPHFHLLMIKSNFNFEFYNFIY